MNKKGLLKNFTFSFVLLCLSFAFAWQVLSWQNFHYGFWYKQLDIQEHIEKYVPQNRHGKRSFIDTTSAQHEALFMQVVESINNDGQGLADIQYQTSSGKLHTLFTNAEVVHLQDVSNLLTLGANVSLVCAFLFIVLFCCFFYTQDALAPIRYHCIYGLGITVGLVVLVLLIGAKKVFYWLHIKVFPDDHQWFFYYQDSLMASFMKAPDLFAPIAVEWVVVALISWLMLLWLLGQTLKRFSYH